MKRWAKIRKTGQAWIVCKPILKHQLSRKSQSRPLSTTSNFRSHSLQEHLQRSLITLGLRHLKNQPKTRSRPKWFPPSQTRSQRPHKLFKSIHLLNLSPESRLNNQASPNQLPGGLICRTTQKWPVLLLSSLSWNKMRRNNRRVLVNNRLWVALMILIMTLISDFIDAKNY